MKEKELARMAIEARILQRQGAALQQEAGRVGEDIEGINVGLETIRSMKKGKEEIVIPVGGGIYVMGRIWDRDKVLVGVGENVFVEMSLKEAEEVLKELKKKATKSKERLEEEITRISDRLRVLDEKARKLMKKG